MSQGESTSELSAALRLNGLPFEAGAPLFVGRERELQTLQAALESTLEGSGRVVLLGGEAGIGKTSTCQAFAAAAGRAGATVLRGRCFEGAWSPPYAPWVESLDVHARSYSPEMLRANLGLGAPALAAILPGIRQLLPETPRPASLAPKEERFRLYDAAVQFLTITARQTPIVLILDDIHWADSASLRLLRHVARFVDRAPLLVIAAYRDGQADQSPAMTDTLPEIRREQSALVVRLRGLTRVEVAEYLGRSVRHSIAPELADAIFDETVGNPSSSANLSSIWSRRASSSSATASGQFRTTAPGSTTSACPMACARWSGVASATCRPRPTRSSAMPRSSPADSTSAPWLPWRAWTTTLARRA